MVSSKILQDVKRSGLFSVINDTTTNIANVEQYTFIIRFVSEEGKVQERLVALAAAPDATGLGMFNVFCDITEKYQINWKEELIGQAYNGANSMQGQYSGLRTRIQKEKPRAVYIWCSAHLLNLVVVDTCDCCTDTKSFFGEIASIVEFLRARKRNAVFLKYQEIKYPKQRKRRLKRFSNTRWTSHDRVLLVIYKKFNALVASLDEISTGKDFDRDSMSYAKSLKNIITSFKFVLILIFMRNIFAITTEESKYLQSISIDYIAAIKLVDVAKHRLRVMRSEVGCINVINDAKKFANDNGLEQNSFKVTRKRTIKIMPGEKAAHETSSLPSEKFRIEVYYVVLETIINSIEMRFKGSREILKDLCFLSPQRMIEFTNNNKTLPIDAFQNISQWIPSIDLSLLKVKYITFSNNLSELLEGQGLYPDKYVFK
ncbi:zinc finger MYM-type protein 1-like [Myzus persicae]|uniref:zinc finger MYM-type protein 1-like n=1 Tax=Myzus persicae TaxID=13164 RepID=UPI000B938E6F|nr:zinc finger MYM-type protein 1-like [Myzus persicae]